MSRSRSRSRSHSPRPRPRDDGVKLFVYGVHRSCPRDTLEDEFARHGEVTDVIITDKGYAFITMTDEGAARKALKEINGVFIDGQEVKVEIAHGKGGARRDSFRDRGGYRDRGYDRRDRDYGGRGGGGYGRDRDRRSSDSYRRRDYY